MPNLSNLIQTISEQPALQNPLVHYALLILPAVFGLIYCLYGYRLARALSTLVGAVLGVIVGYAIISVAQPEFPINLVIIVAAAIVFGLIGFFLYRLGVFLMIFPLVFGAAAALLTKYTTLDPLVVAVISLAAGLILGILSVVYDRPLIIIASALGGALVFVNQIFSYLIRIRWDDRIEMYVRLGVGAVLAIIGLIYQFRSTRGLKTRGKRAEDED